MPNHKLIVRPSAKLLALIEVHGSVNAAAEAFDIEYRSLRRFIDGELSFNLETAGRIATKSGLSLDQLFNIAA